MSLRDRLLALLRAPSYSPANEFELANRLGLKKKERAMLAHEVRLVLKAGQFARGQNGRIAPRGGAAATPRAEQRPVFTPSRLRGATAPTPPASSAPPSPDRGRSPEQKRGAQRGSQPAASASAPTKPTLGEDELTGRIQFRAGGSAFVVRDDPASLAMGEPALQVFPEDTGVALPGDRVLAREFPGRKGRRPGEKIGGIVRVLERGRSTIVGDLRRDRRAWIVQPDDPRFSFQILVDDPAKSDVTPRPEEGDKVIVSLHEWKRRNDPLTGVLTARLGRTHEPRAEMLGVFEKYDLSPNFPEDVEREAAALPDRVQPRDLANRLDYREVPTFTIDPDDAKDFDDALSIESLDGGEVRVGIHIADVSAYVRQGTALDREAQRRGNSTYLVGTVIPMLPEKLSNGLCSLVEAQDRLCKAVFLTFGKTGAIRHTAYANTVIRSRKRLTYKQAYAFLFDNDLGRIRALPLPPKHQTGSTGRALRDLSDGELVDLQQWVRTLWRLASKLRKDRMAHGSLDLDMPETKIFVDEKGYADRLEKIEHDESHQLIEEFMLAANEAVAHVTRANKLPSLYRVHDDPDPEKLNELRGQLKTFDILVGDLSQRDEVVKLLEILRTHPQGYTLRTQLLRSLKKAAYRSTPDGHYGLAKRDYTHFTSPIRRYADLVVHRVFDYYLIKHQGYPASTDRAGYNLSGVERLGEHLSLTEINSAEAERESVKIKLLEFFEREVTRKPKTKFAAIITDVRPNGFFLELVESMTFGFVSMNTLDDDRYYPNSDASALVGRKTKRKFALNGRIDVVVEKVDRFKRLIDFRPV